MVNQGCFIRIVVFPCWIFYRDPEDRGKTDWGERDAGRAERRCQHWFQGGEEKEKERSSRKIRLEYIQIFYSCIVHFNSLCMYPVIQKHLDFFTKSTPFNAIRTQAKSFDARL